LPGKTRCHRSAAGRNPGQYPQKRGLYRSVRFLIPWKTQNQRRMRPKDDTGRSMRHTGTERSACSYGLKDPALPGNGRSQASEQARASPSLRLTLYLKGYKGYGTLTFVIIQRIKVRYSSGASGLLHDSTVANHVVRFRRTPARKKRTRDGGRNFPLRENSTNSIIRRLTSLLRRDTLRGGCVKANDGSMPNATRQT